MSWSWVFPWLCDGLTRYPPFSCSRHLTVIFSNSGLYIYDLFGFPMFIIVRGYPCHLVPFLMWENRTTNNMAMFPTKLNQKLSVFIILITRHSMSTYYVFNDLVIISYLCIEVSHHCNYVTSLYTHQGFIQKAIKGFLLIKFSILCRGVALYYRYFLRLHICLFLSVKL